MMVIVLTKDFKYYISSSPMCVPQPFLPSYIILQIWLNFTFLECIRSRSGWKIYLSPLHLISLFLSFAVVTSIYYLLQPFFGINIFFSFLNNNKNCGCRQCTFHCIYWLQNVCAYMHICVYKRRYYTAQHHFLVS